MEQSPAIDTDAVAQQYDQWVYPKPLSDLASSVESGEYWDLCDPSLFRRKLWPRKIEPDAPSILVAGCGANQAACLAFKNPASSVVGIDVSQAAIRCEENFKEKHSLNNLELFRMSLNQVGTLDRNFDLIVSTGVLHHLPDPDAGLRSLRDVLRPNGVIGVMVYGYYPRFGVYMMQEMFRVLELKQDGPGVAMVKQTLASLPPWHHLHRYLSSAPDLDYDSGIVDTFLHGLDRAFTVPDVLRFARGNGLKLQSWLDNLDYAISASLNDAEHPVRRMAETRRPEEQWQLVELFAQSLARHVCLLCHPTKDPASYTPDFAGEAWLDYVPSVRFPLQVLGSEPPLRSGRFWKRVRGSLLRPPPNADRSDASGPSAGGNGTQIRRGWHTSVLTAFEAALLERVDGARRIREIIDVPAPDGESRRALAARDFFRRMAEWDHLLFEIP